MPPNNQYQYPEFQEPQLSTSEFFQDTPEYVERFDKDEAYQEAREVIQQLQLRRQSMTDEQIARAEVREAIHPTPKRLRFSRQQTKPFTSEERLVNLESHVAQSLLPSVGKEVSHSFFMEGGDFFYSVTDQYGTKTAHYILAENTFRKFVDHREYPLFTSDSIDEEENLLRMISSYGKLTGVRVYDAYGLAA